MSTLTGPDLTAGVEAVERLMDDTLLISATPSPDDWTLNPTSLRLEPPAATVLYAGKGKVRPLGNAAQRVTTEGGLDLGLDGYQIDLPIASARLPEGCTAVLTSSRRMAIAVGEVFVVKRLVTKTLAVQARYLAERRERIVGYEPISSTPYPSEDLFPGPLTYPIGA